MNRFTMRPPDDHTVRFLGRFTALFGGCTVVVWPFAPGHLTMLLFIVTMVFGLFLLWAVFDLPT